MAVGLQSFLQLMAQRKVMSENEAIDYLESISTYIAPGMASDPDAVIKQINRRLKCMDLEIRGYRVDNQDKVFALVNLVSDEVAKHEGAQLDDLHLDIFKKILFHLSEASDNAIPARDLEGYKGKLTAPKFKEFLQALCDAHWLAKEEEEDDDDDDDDNGLVTYGPRSYLELTDNLRAVNVDTPQIIHLI
ncbi:hypothetical protein CTAYLR_007520 [Chrysophaeum taylorii]|uniref:Non-structural maintenance of chromosomes element 1 homolog n=1 Tax=Chrysophaeum taylorii TaxID=2483200 RepID=A0AAD7U6I4_9STRA|nr:hypothetical protein CTAYLR_007520 [Chrysophaeum taylorii]